jgi:hypothetical protein
MALGLHCSINQPTSHENPDLLCTPSGATAPGAGSSAIGGDAPRLRAGLYLSWNDPAPHGTGAPVSPGVRVPDGVAERKSMIAALEIVSIVAFVFAAVTISACLALAGFADRQTERFNGLQS